MLTIKINLNLLSCPVLLLKLLKFVIISYSMSWLPDGCKNGCKNGCKDGCDDGCIVESWVPNHSIARVTQNSWRAFTAAVGPGIAV